MCESDHNAADAFVADFLEQTPLPVTEGGDCPYLPGREARSEGFFVSESIDGAVYRALMDCGFRRSGSVFYRPRCETCNLCIPIRIPTATFRPTRSQRRVVRRNADVHVTIGQPTPTDEKHALYARYLDAQHDGTMSTEREAFENFLYDSPVPGLEICYHIGRRLVGVSLVDELPGAWSSVYMYFDPEVSRRSLGTFSAVWEIEHCRSAGIPYYYLGFYVPGSRTMEYKARFQPAEILDEPARWRPFDRPENAESTP